MDYSPLIAHLKLFALGVNRSVQWAKDAETLLDDLEPWDQSLDELQDGLSLYRPEGGAHLIDDAAMAAFVHRALGVLQARVVDEEPVDLPRTMLDGDPAQDKARK